MWLMPEARRRIPVTIVMPVLDEARELAEALGDLRWADEVIVVDGGSTDGSAELARQAGARVLVVAGLTIAAQRNAGIAAARHRWIVALDVDERITSELRDSIERLATGIGDREAHEVFRVRSRNWHLGRELRFGPWGRDWKMRVFTSDHRYAEARVHEHLDSPGLVGALSGTLLHHPYRDLGHQVVKIARYARWAAADMRAHGRRASMVDILARPTWRFARDYVVYSGWRDGLAGLVVAGVSAFSVFIKYASLRLEPPESAPESATGRSTPVVTE